MTWPHAWLQDYMWLSLWDLDFCLPGRQRWALGLWRICRAMDLVRADILGFSLLFPSLGTWCLQQRDSFCGVDRETDISPHVSPLVTCDTVEMGGALYNKLRKELWQLVVEKLLRQFWEIMEGGGIHTSNMLDSCASIQELSDASSIFYRLLISLCYFTIPLELVTWLWASWVGLFIMRSIIYRGYIGVFDHKVKGCFVIIDNCEQRL